MILSEEQIDELVNQCKGTIARGKDGNQQPYKRYSLNNTNMNKFLIKLEEIFGLSPRAKKSKENINKKLEEAVTSAVVQASEIDWSNDSINIFEERKRIITETLNLYIKN